MNTIKHSHFLYAQITIAPWYIDRALSPLVAPTDQLRFLNQAKQAYGIVVQFLPELGLEPPELERLGQVLTVLRLRLDRANAN